MIRAATEKEYSDILGKVGGDYAAPICIVDEENGELQAAVIVEHYTGSSCSLHVWIKRMRLQFTCFIFKYIFVTLNCQRFSGIVPDDNLTAVAFNEKIGGEVEAVLKSAHPRGDILMFVHHKHTLKKYWSRDHGRKT